MRYFILLTLSLYLTVNLFSREYQFKENSFTKKVLINGKEYRIFEPHNLNLKLFPELKSLIYNPKRPIFLVINKQGYLVRDKLLIQQAFFAEKYSNLNRTQLNSILSDYNKTNYKINESTSLLEGENKSYFTNLKSLVLFLEGKKNSNQITSQNRTKFYLLLKDLYKNPSECYRNILHEILDKSQKLNFESIQLLKKIEYQIVSFRQAKQIENQRLALASAEAVLSLIEQDVEGLSVNFYKANIYNKDFFKKFNGKIPIHNIENIKLDSLYQFTYSLFQKLFSKVSIHQQIMENLAIYKCQYMELLNDYRHSAEISKNFLPLYKGNYKQYPIPNHILKKFPNSLFYDNFKSNLKRWVHIGNSQNILTEDGLNNNGDGWYYSGISSKVLFHPDEGRLILQSKAKIGTGKGTFGFGEKKLGDHGKKGVVPFIGFLFNQDIEGSGTVDLRINNEKVPSQIRIIIDLNQLHDIKIIISKDDGIHFFIDNRKVFSHPFKANFFGSESVVLSSTSNDYRWREVLVRQRK